MNEKQQRDYDLQERLIESAVRVLDAVESLPNSIPSFPSFLHHSWLDIQFPVDPHFPNELPDCGMKFAPAF